MTEQKFNLTQPDDAHRVTVTKEDGSNLVYCEDCGRLFRWGHKIFEVLVRGDQYANHSHTITSKDAKLTMGIEKIKVRTEEDAKVEHLLGDVSIDL